MINILLTLSAGGFIIAIAILLIASHNKWPDSFYYYTDHDDSETTKRGQ